MQIKKKIRIQNDFSILFYPNFSNLSNGFEKSRNHCSSRKEAFQPLFYSQVKGEAELEFRSMRCEQLDVYQHRFSLEIAMNLHWIKKWRIYIENDGAAFRGITDSLTSKNLHCHALIGEQPVHQTFASNL
jgi:hypothetical protein